MPSLEIICMASFADVSLYQTFLTDRFKGLMVFTNLHFSSIYLTRLYDGVDDQLQYKAGGLSLCLFSTVLPLHSNLL